MDEGKRLSNLANHGVDFRDLDALDWPEALLFEDRASGLWRASLIAMGKLGSRLTSSSLSSEPETDVHIGAQGQQKRDRLL